MHRIGRTARAGAEGISVTFVDWDELARWKMIDTALGLAMPEPEETYSSSEHLYQMLNIPAGSTGRLRPAKIEAAPVRKSEPRQNKSGQSKASQSESRESSKIESSERALPLRQVGEFALELRSFQAK